MKVNLKKLLIDSTQSPLWRLIAQTQICSSPDHRNVTTAEPSRLIPRKLAANLERVATKQRFLRHSEVL